VLKKLVLLLAFSCSAFGQLINPHELPFGCYSSHWANDTFFTNHEPRLRLMHDTLGFNQNMCGGFTDQAVDAFLAKGIAPYPWVGTGGNDWQVQYAECQYLICQPESSDYYNCKFTIMGNMTKDTANGYVYGTNGSSLYGLDFSHPSSYYNLDQGVNIQYHPEFRLRVSSRSPGDSATPVAIYQADLHCCEDTGLVFLDTIKFGNLNGTQFTSLPMINSLNPPDSFFYVRPSGDTLHYNEWVRHDLFICAPCTVYVDWFKLYCQNGKKLVEGDSLTTQNQLVLQSIRRPGFDGQILGWFLKDTERPGNYRPMAHIDSLIKYASGWSQPTQAVAWLTPSEITFSWGSSYRDFIRIVKPDLLWTYLYPIDRNTAYTGFINAQHGNYLYFHSDSLQRDFASCITDPLDSLCAVLPQAGANAKWLYTPQYWYRPDTCNDEDRRQPTKSEVRCMTYLGLCYGASSILGWLFDYGGDDACHYNGLLMQDGSLSPVGQVIRDDINPYIKAIDSLYMELTLTKGTAYICDSTGAVSFIQSIDTISGSNINNPDAGWFQLGEYIDSSELSARYFMLVNRACSRGPEDSTEAPPVTAIVRLDPNALGSDYALIIDIAESVYHDTVANTYRPVPETTYSGVLDSTIPYTVMLKAGEGRLFKVIPTSEIPYEAPLEYQGFFYQGGLKYLFYPDSLS
jgi:hypothetical protein